MTARAEIGVLPQFLRYAVVGGFAAMVDTSLLYLLYRHFGANRLLAAAAGFTAGLVVNYVASILFVFRSRGEIAREFTLFVVIGIGGLALTELILWLGIDLAHLSVLVAKAFALVLVLVWNFAMRKKFVFGE